MTDYITIDDVDVDAESPIDEYLLRRLRDNVLAIAEGASGAPRFATASIGDGTVNGSTDLADNTISNGFIAAGGTYIDDYDAAVQAQLYINGWYHGHSNLDNGAVTSYVLDDTYFNLTFLTYSSTLVASGATAVIPQGIYNMVINSSADRAGGDIEFLAKDDATWHGREDPSGSIWSDGTNVRFHNRSGGNVTYYWQRLR